MKCLLLTKDHAWGGYATAMARHIFDDVTVYAGKTGTPYPAEAASASYDVMISYLSPWIVPPAELARSPLALNFHPGSSRYPGSGCYNFALYEEAAQYGCVCHHMAAKPDTGPIIAERLFDITAADTVESLQLKCLTHMTSLFLDICERLRRGERFADAAMAWQRVPYTMRGFEALKRLEPGMSEEEVRRRVRATRYPRSEGAYHMDNGVKRYVEPMADRTPLAFAK